MLYSFSCCLSNKFRAFRGKVSGTSKLNQHHVYLMDLPAIVELSFRLGVFSAQQRCYSQTHGTSIGNQISPILSSIAVAWVEETWRSIHRTWWNNNHNHLFFSRYVDNRFVLCPLSQVSSPAFRIFSRPDFYIHPVI
jgi:hypothetical protein